MKGLYLLSFLLTADRKKAEECFVAALEDSTRSNRIFRDFAYSWSRRTTIQNAIRLIQPAPDPRPEKTPLRTIDTEVETRARSGTSLNAILSLRPFERFVFVMSVLERYSDQDCSILLACSRRDVALARTQAPELISAFVDPRLQDVASRPDVLPHERLLPAGA
jgi:DNA-directed RNA polymerase specialized sigma24 family protein